MATTNLNSGATAKATTSDAAVELIAATEVTVNHVAIINAGAVAGFFSVDGGTTWNYLAALMATVLDDCYVSNKAIQVKRVASGSNLSGVWAFAWRGR